MDEKSNDSWAAGRADRVGGVRFEPRSGATGVSPGGDRDPAAGAIPADIVFIVKQDGTILYLNRAGPGGSEAGYQGRSVLDFTGSEQREALRESLDLVFSQGVISGYECSGVDPFTEGAWYQCRVAPNVRDGKVVSATIIARDITSWKRLEDEERQKRVELEQDLARVRSNLETLTNGLAERECLQHELERFREILDRSGEAIFITDPETGRFVDVNETACRWLGFERDKLLTLTIGDLDLEFPLASPNGVPDHVTDTRTSHRPTIYDEGTHRRRNGTRFPVEVAIVRRKLADRDYQLIVARDVKGRRQNQRALRESQTKYRSLFELSRDAIYLSARDGSVADVNDAAIDLFGYSRTEFVGLQASKLYVRSRDIRTFQNGVEEAGAVRDLELEFQAKHGRTFRGLLTATLRNDGDGNILGYQCIIRPCGQNGDARLESADSEPLEVGELPEGAVLVVDGDKHVLTETRSVLERAGMGVVTARTFAAGSEILRSQSGDIGTVLLGTDQTGADPLEALQELQEISPRAHMVVMVDESELGAVRAAVAPAGAEVMPKPIHPIALVQHVRDVRASDRP